MEPFPSSLDRAAPAAWEVEAITRQVLAITCEHYGLDPRRVSPEDRLGVEIVGDSLDAVEYLMELEETFDVTVSDAVAERWFKRPLRLRELTALLLTLPRTGRPIRSFWGRRQPPAPGAEGVPFTQEGGALSENAWRAGPLYEDMGRNREGFPQYRRRTDGMRCVLVPGGEATLGSDDAEALADQRPPHTATLSAFLLDAEPVSNLAFARFLSSIGPLPPAVLNEWGLFDPADRRATAFALKLTRKGWEPLPGTERQPMVLVSWYGANAYSLWAGVRDWRLYRGDGSVPGELRQRSVPARPAPDEWLFSLLPSEGQWEYAARGAKAFRYPWGDEPPTPGRLRAACHVPGMRYLADALPAATVCERLGMSPFGLHHMAGNVWQWCRDWYNETFYQRPEARDANPLNRTPTRVRSERGGSWIGPAELCRSSYRRGRPPHARGRCLGFRCISSVKDVS